MENSIQEKVLIVRLHISKYNPWGYDREAARKVAQIENSKESDVHTTKRKISKKAIQEISDLLNKAYTYHISVTMPSGAEGDRLITTDMYPAYCQRMNSFQVQVNAAVDRFIPEYPSWISEAQERLQGLFKDSDYPSVNEISSKFSLRYSFLPLPSVNNIVVDLVNGELSKIKQSVTEEMNKMSATAMKSLWDRTYDAIAHMAEILGNSEARLHATLISNVGVLCGVLKSLNFSNDPELESLRMKIETRLAGRDPEELRKNRSIRLEVAEDAKAIVAEISEKRKLRVD
jgi:hypothetical protein